MTHTVRRLGQADDLLGSGASALNFSYDPATGLSNDPTLPVYLQNLTPGQLQTALNPDTTGSSTLAMSQSVLQQLQTGQGLPCGTPANPTCGPTGGSLSSWVWIAGGAVLIGVLFLGGKR